MKHTHKQTQTHTHTEREGEREREREGGADVDQMCPLNDGGGLLMYPMKYDNIFKLSLICER